MRSSSNPVVGDLAARLRSTIAFYASRPSSQPISQVFVTGAGATIEGLVPALTAAIDEPIAVISTSDVIPVKSVPTGDLALNLVSTIGVALGEVR